MLLLGMVSLFMLSCYLRSFIRELSRNNRTRTCLLALAISRPENGRFNISSLIRASCEISFGDVIQDLNALVKAYTFSQHYFRHRNFEGYNLIIRCMITFVTVPSFPELVEMILLRMSSGKQVQLEKKPQNTALNMIDTF